MQNGVLIYYVLLTLTTSSPQIDALLPYLDLVPARKHLQIRSECARVDDLVVPEVGEILAEKNVFVQRRILNPGLLGDVGDVALSIEMIKIVSYMFSIHVKDKLITVMNALTRL